MRVLPPLNALRAFEAAARYESFSRAADEMGVSHSAISRHVRGLEARLGVALFRDQSRGVVLTPEGRHYAQRIAPAFDVIGDATEGLSGAPAGRVVVNSEPLFAAKVVAPLLADFQAEMPDIDLRLIGSSDLADLDRYEADLAIRFSHKGVLDVPADLLSDAPIHPFAAPGLLQDDVLRPDDLGRVPLLRDRREDLWPRWAQAAGWAVSVDESPYRLRASLAVEAAIAGAGVFLAASDTTRNDARAERLVQVSNVGIRSGAFYLLSSGASARRKAVRHVRRWMLVRTQDLRTGKDQPDG